MSGIYIKKINNRKHHEWGKNHQNAKKLLKNVN